MICPKCDSIMKSISEKKGFSTGKAVAGGLLFGPIGLLIGGAGIGKKKTSYQCTNCGYIVEK